ncbi:spore coat protein regulator protein YlbO [Anoxybacillus gonensis]|uniref:Spore coat protein regulator protein YlbO n=1 Tax=Anoxybacillus gonensis TaxID=198467 RepID=A0AAW7TCL4_9BACL|nr:MULTISPECIES: spore coat protein regulator YlbO [Bacillaceae]MCG5025974.1 spore coat protein regulator protein YlbO [Anoxybacillus flavithermus]AKS37650.1 spore coat protein regulator protein YlbO [Anoxybacillus gonensis]KGP61573.1 spore coat protein regulator protein YlbO [Anoxybacillus gonensis]MCG3085582.1 spore coat protein regulator protein YlbO [Anoxybacillus sp. LAT27]MCG6170840.1 spore coat protein regulator protein YlbO [Anoxybacillus sp. LAT_11]
MQEIDMLRAENVLLKELAELSEQRYQEVKRLKKENEELKKQIEQLTKQLFGQGTDSWFMHTVKRQQALKQGGQLPLSTPFSFTEKKK